jgi:hypothetical protein
MFFKKQQTSARIVTDAEKDAVIKEYLERIRLAYTDQPISAERLIEMELQLIENRNVLRTPVVLENNRFV